MYFNDQENRASIDSELLVNNAVLLRKPVDAVVTLPHPTGKNLHFRLHVIDEPADGAADGVGGEASGHAAGGLVNGGEIDLGTEETSLKCDGDDKKHL